MNSKVLGLDEDNFQNVPVDDIESPHVNLMDLLIDGSGSMRPQLQPMADSLKSFKNAVSATKENEANELLISRVDFRERKITASGYRRIDDFDTNYDAGGLTPLYGAIIKTKEELMKYKKELENRGMTTKAVVAIFSDGDETVNESLFSGAKAALDELRRAEIKVVFIAFGDERDQVKQRARDLGFIEEDIKDAGEDEHSLRKTFDVLSKSVSNFSKSTNGAFTM